PGASPETSEACWGSPRCSGTGLGGPPPPCNERPGPTPGCCGRGRGYRRRAGVPLLEAREVSVRYAGLVAADTVSLSVDAGELVGLIGPNGAGKTTFLDAVSGYVRPEGSVFLDGREVTGWEPEKRATLGMARTFQRLELFTTMTVFENLLVAAEATFAEAEFIMDVVGRRRRGRGHELAERTVARLGLEQVAFRLAGEVPLGIG